MDRKALALECLDVEEAGGSVRQFLHERGCLSPWGTWYRLQIEELGRKDAQITDGRGDEEKMKKITLEQKKKAVQIAIDGGDPLEYLRNHGSKNPSGLWWTIKNDVKSADPELYARIPMLNAVRKNKPEKDEPVPVDGSEVAAAVKMTTAATVRKEEIPHVEAWIADTRMGGFTVTSVRGKFGEYHMDIMNKSLDFTSTEGVDICMTPQAWKGFVDEVSRVMEILKN